MSAVNHHLMICVFLGTDPSLSANVDEGNEDEDSEDEEMATKRILKKVHSFPQILQIRVRHESRITEWPVLLDHISGNS